MSVQLVEVSKKPRYLQAGPQTSAAPDSGEINDRLEHFSQVKVKGCVASVACFE